MNEQEFSELAAGYALNALSPEDERAYTAALFQHPEWNEIVAQDAATAAALARGVAQVAPPLGSRGALLSLIARTAQYPQRPAAPAVSAADGRPLAATLTAVPAEASPSETSTTDAEAAGEAPVIPGFEDATHQTQEADAPDAPDPAVTSSAPVESTPTDVVQTVARRTWMRGVFALAASLALLVTMGFGAALIGQQIGRSPAQIALERIEDAPDAQTAGVAVEGGGEATAFWSESLGDVVLVTDGLPSLASGETYQLWFVRGDEQIDSAGLFTTDRDGEATSLLNGTVEAGDTIAVSIEPAGGSQQPTTTPIIAIPTAT